MKLPFSEVSNKSIVSMCIHKNELTIATKSDIYKVDNATNTLTLVTFNYDKPPEAKESKAKIPELKPKMLEIPKESFSSDNPLSNKIQDSDNH